MLAFPRPFRVTFADPTRAVALPAGYDQPGHLARDPLPNVGPGIRGRVIVCVEQGRPLCLIGIKQSCLRFQPERRCGLSHDEPNGRRSCSGHGHRYRDCGRDELDPFPDRHRGIP
jgi:hypothetical protein